MQQHRQEPLRSATRRMRAREEDHGEDRGFRPRALSPDRRCAGTRQCGPGSVHDATLGPRPTCLSPTSAHPVVPAG